MSFFFETKSQLIWYHLCLTNWLFVFLFWLKGIVLILSQLKYFDTAKGSTVVRILYPYCAIVLNSYFATQLNWPIGSTVVLNYYYIRSINYNDAYWLFYLWVVAARGSWTGTVRFCTRLNGDPEQGSWMVLHRAAMSWMGHMLIPLCVCYSFTLSPFVFVYEEDKILSCLVRNIYF